MAGARTLIVDDNEGMRLVARTLVEEAGGQVVAEAADGHEGVERARETQPDLILMDHRMPRCDGIEATESIKAAEPAATVVAWTSVADPVVSERFFAAGAEMFVVKDDLATLQSVLRRYC